MEWIAENEGISLFEPHGGQIEFINLIARKGGFITISGAGNGWGKSELLIAIFAAIMWPTLAPSCFDKPIFKHWKYPKRARIYSSPAELEQIGSLQTAIARLFPKDKYSAEKGHYGYPSVFHTDTGWVMDLFSYERNKAEAAGPNIGLQAINEPPPEDLFSEAVARSRAGGIIIGGMTSLDDNPWVVDGILGKHNGKDIAVRYGNSCENCIQHGINGHLEHEKIEQILSIYPKDQREARFTGKPLSISGRIFKAFDRDVHVVKAIEPKGQIYQVVDPAGGKPLAVIYANVDEAGIVTIFDEYPNEDFVGAQNPGLSLTDYRDIFAVKEGSLKVKQRIIDRRYANARHKPGDKTLREQFDDLGLDFEDSYHVGENLPEVEIGIQAITDYLWYDKSKPLDAINKPRLYVTENCKNTISALEKWSRNPKTLKPNDDGYKDHCDCVRYLVKANPEFDLPLAWPSGISKPYHTVQSA